MEDEYDIIAQIDNICSSLVFHLLNQRVKLVSLSRDGVVKLDVLSSFVVCFRTLGSKCFAEAASQLVAR